MKQTMIFIAFFALWMSVQAQVNVTKKLVTSEADAYRVNTGTKTGLIFVGMEGSNFQYGELLSDNTIQMFPNIPDPDMASVNDFCYFDATGKWYAVGAGWASGVYSYEYNPKDQTWTANPFNTDGPIQYVEQFKNSILISGGFTRAGDDWDIEFPHTCLFTASGTMTTAPNNDGAVRTTNKSGTLFVSALQGFDVLNNVRLTDLNTGEAYQMPLLPLGYEAAGVAIDFFSGTVYVSTWKPYGGDNFQLMSAKSGDTEWTSLLPEIGGQVNLQFQNGLVAASGSKYNDGVKVSTSTLWLYNPVTGETIDPMAEKLWCPVNTLFIDCEAKGENLIFTASYLKKGSQDVTIAKLKFLPAPEKVEGKMVQLKMYPNPASDYIVIEGAEKFTVTNLLGMPVLTSTDQKIDVSNFAPGMYFANGEPFVVVH